MRPQLFSLTVLLGSVLDHASAQVAPAIAWEHALGSSVYEQLEDLVPTADGGSIMLGVTYGNDGDVLGMYTIPNIWVVKLTATGSLEWQRVLGGSGYDLGTSIQQTPDGGYILSGYTGSADGDVSFNHGERDAWLVNWTHRETCFGSAPTAVVSATKACPCN
ncbi:MAG: hypothetical protein IPO17_17350 [Flavobacteriales bacterium]|nr:hypothetical protein [Flavobacteriales bacterium]